MDKVNEFEHGLDGDSNERSGNIAFSEASNEHFRYSSADELLNTEVGKKALNEMIRVFFDVQVKRLKVLKSYAQGNNFSITHTQRRLDKEKADYRVKHKWGGYISSFITSYVTGNPVTIGVRNGENEQQLEVIDELEWQNDLNALNSDLAFDASVYGRAYEFHFRDTSNIDRVVLISPLEMFVIRDLTVEQNIIAAVHAPQFGNEINVTVYTDSQVVTFKPFTVGSIKLQGAEVSSHGYQDIPVVEWWNNRFRAGDYESEISLIDAYDASQSDTANYMSDLNDAMLLIKGDLESLDLGPEEAAKMKEANTLLLQTGLSPSGQQTSADASYIYKQYDVNGTEAYKNRLAADIHRFSRIPNLEDDRFNMTASGIALLYKMIGLEQVRKDKETYFTKALRRRYELIGNMRNFVNGPRIEPDKLTFTFHANVPQDIWTEIKAYIEAGGVVSQETLLNNATFTNFIDEKKRLLKEEGASDFEVTSVQGVEDGEETED